MAGDVSGEKRDKGPLDRSERFKIDMPFEDAMRHILSVKWPPDEPEDEASEDDDGPIES